MIRILTLSQDSSFLVKRTLLYNYFRFMKHQSKTQVARQKKIKKMVTTILSFAMILAIVFVCIKKCSNDNSNQHTNNVVYGRGIALPNITTINIQANEVNINNGIDIYNPKSNFWFVCDKCGYALDNIYQCINQDCKAKYSSSKKLNSDCYYMTFALYLYNNDELLYESGLIEPDEHIHSINLSRPLEAGTYSAYLFVQPYKADKITLCNNGKMDIKLVVE